MKTNQQIKDCKNWIDSKNPENKLEVIALAKQYWEKKSLPADYQSSHGN